MSEDDASHVSPLTVHPDDVSIGTQKSSTSGLTLPASMSGSVLSLKSPPGSIVGQPAAAKIKTQKSGKSLASITSGNDLSLNPGTTQGSTAGDPAETTSVLSGASTKKSRTQSKSGGGDFDDDSISNEMAGDDRLLDHDPAYEEYDTRQEINLQRKQVAAKLESQPPESQIGKLQDLPPPPPPL